MTNNTVKERDISSQKVTEQRSQATQIIQKTQTTYSTHITVLQNCGSNLPTALLQGYDSISGRGLSTAVTGTTTNASGNNSLNLSVCLDIATLAKALKIEQSLSAGFGAITNFAPKMQFLQNLKLTAYSTSIVLYASQATEIETANHISLTNSIAPANNKTELNSFFQAYGDSYVSSITKGAEYYAVYTFYTQSIEEQSSLIADMKAHGIYGGMTVNAALQSKLTNFVNSCAMRSTFKQNISGTPLSTMPEPSNLIAFALEMPTFTINTPAIISFETKGYEQVAKIGNFEPIQINRNYFTGLGPVEGLTKRLVQTQQLLNQINYLQDTYEFYGGYTDNKVLQVKKQANNDLIAINNQIQQYEFDPTQNFTTPALPSLTYGSPELRYQAGTSPSYGNNDNDTAEQKFNDISSINLAIQQHQRITALQLRHSNKVDCLNVNYENNSGSFQTSHGSSSNGALGPLLTILPGQFISGISGFTSNGDKSIEQLQIQISDDRSISCGSKTNSPFSWNVPENSFVLGFSGKSKTCLNQIQVNYAKFQDANWH